MIWWPLLLLMPLFFLACVGVVLMLIKRAPYLEDDECPLVHRDRDPGMGQRHDSADSQDRRVHQPRQSVAQGARRYFRDTGDSAVRSQRAILPR